MSNGEEPVVGFGPRFWAVVRKPCLSPKINAKMMGALNSNPSQILITIMIFFALFGDDFRLAVFAKSADDVFQGITVFCLLVFFTELVVNLACMPDWRLGFYFWLDLIATVSLIFDITWITDAIAGNTSDSETILLESEESPGDDDEEGSAAALKVGRASRAGTKAGRVVRIVRLIRLVRLVKLYKQREKLRGNEIIDSSLPVLDAEPSKVGKRLTELATIRIIILILMMIVILPFIDNSSIVADYKYQAQQSEIESLHRFAQWYNSSGVVNISKEVLARRTQETASHMDFTILNIDITNQQSEDAEEWLRVKTPGLKYEHDFRDFKYIANHFRENEYVQIRAFGCFNSDDIAEPIADANENCGTRITFSVLPVQQAAAWLSIIKTLFIMVLLGGAIVLITKDAEVLVIVPIERMMVLVKRLAENPLGSTKVDAALVDESDERQAREEGYETVMLEQTLSKIGGLLQVGFGVAGSQIIGANMNAEGALNVLIPGQKVTCVVVFGIIEDFTETCSCLAENICTYINTIADIVHGNAHDWFGAANKNIGSAFLLVWKLCNGQLPGLRDPRDGDDVPRRPANEIADERKSLEVVAPGCKGARKAVRVTVQNMIDASLLAVLKMCVELYHANRSTGKLYPFCRDSKMVEAFGDHYHVGMGFGMHIGWAIEGAIGSKYKVDASYLSPNVNMAARLEAATHMYGVHVLLSEWFAGELSASIRNHCRKLDRVTVKGSEVPMEMWTFDITSHPEKFLVPEIDAETGKQVVPNFDDVKSLLMPLQQNINPDFKTNYDEGMKHYLGGKWADAKVNFEKANALKGSEDKPCQLLLRVMGSQNFIAPSTWKGFRELTSKT